MTIYLGADHRGFNLKEKLKKILTDEAYDVVEMERARSELAMHRSVCATAIAAAAAEPDPNAQKLPATAAPPAA